jgi:hypothetical protein
MPKKSVLSLLMDSPESIIAAAEEVEKEITGVAKEEEPGHPANNDEISRQVSTDDAADDEKTYFDIDSFFREQAGKKIEYRPSLMSAEFLERIKYLSIVFDVPMKDITYNICNYWWETHKTQIQKAVKKKKKDFIL